MSNKLIEKINEYLNVGGFFNPELMEHHKVSDLLLECRNELERLATKCDKQAMVIRRVYVDDWPNQWFAWHGYGPKDENGLPQYIEVVPAYGVDWTQVYEKINLTIGGMGS